MLPSGYWIQLWDAGLGAVLRVLRALFLRRRFLYCRVYGYRVMFALDCNELFSIVDVQADAFDLDMGREQSSQRDTSRKTVKVAEAL